MKQSILWWYAENRMEYLRNRQKTIQGQLDLSQNVDQFPYDLLAEFVENKGRIRELENIIEHSKQW